MASPDDNLSHQLDAYLDQQLIGDDRTQFENSAKNQRHIAEQIELQKQIDSSLLRMYAPPAKPRLKLPSLAELQAEDEPQDKYPQHEQSTPNRFSSEVSRPTTANERFSKRWVLGALVTAAAVAWLYVGAEIFLPSGREQIAFHQRPLTKIYQECVDQGFSPYWVCDDEITFANTFEHRQGVKLKLAELPASHKMVGLSYLGGLSRKSTSMLALIEDQPVIVFIDRLENDWKPEIGDFPETGLSVARTERNGLVMYEVSPVAGSSVVDSLLMADPHQ